MMQEIEKWRHDMKRKKIMALSILLGCMMIGTLCFATDTQNPTDVDVATDTQENASADEDIYIDEYDEYEDLINTDDDQMTQDELKEYYEDYKEYLSEYYRTYEREEPIKAKVVEVSPSEEQYEFNEYYYSVSKFEIQPIVVEILEGEHIGERFPISYLLTGDSLSNIRYSEVKVGDTIFVGFTQDEETGEIIADIMNTGSNIERLGVVICLAIIAALLLIIYGGKKGLITVLLLLLIVDFTAVIIPNMGFDGQGFIVGSTIFIGLMIALVSLFKLGINGKAVRAILVSIGMTLLAWVLLAIANYLTRTVGVTFEVAAIAENVLLGNMNFETLFFVTTLMIVAMSITNIVCRVIALNEDHAEETFQEKLNTMKGILPANILLPVMTLMALYIPNQLLLLTNKYTASEIVNSEILISELIRIFVLVMTASIAIPVTVAALEIKTNSAKPAPTETPSKEA